MISAEKYAQALIKRAGWFLYSTDLSFIIDIVRLVKQDIMVAGIVISKLESHADAP